MRNKIAVAIIIITTLIPSVETCLAKQLPFSKPIDFISGKTYGGNKKVWDVEFDDEGRLFVAASEKLCIWDGMDWTSIRQLLERSIFRQRNQTAVCLW